MDIYDRKVRSATFGSGVVTEQSESTVSVDFNGTIKRFLYPSCFEGFLTAEDPVIQREIHSEIVSVKALEARRERTKRRNTMMLKEQQKAKALKSKRRK